MKNWTSNTWFKLAAVFAFASAISFFQIDSALADAHHLNPLFTILGVVFGLTAAFNLYKTYIKSNQ